MAGSESSTDLARVRTLDDDAEALVERLLGIVGGEIGRGIKIKGPVQIPASALQTLGFERAGQFGTGPLEQASDIAALRGLSGAPAFSINPEERERFLDEAVTQPSLRDFSRSVLPAALQGLAGQGLTRGGDAMRVISDASSGLASRINAERAGLVRQDTLSFRQAQENAANRAVGTLPIANELALSRIRVPLQAGAVQRGIETDNRNARIFKQLAQHPAFNPALSLLPAALTPQFATIPKTSSDSTFLGIG